MYELEEEARRIGLKAAKEAEGDWNFQAAWVSGSQLAKLGTPTSDIDLFLLFADGEMPSLPGPVQRVVDGRRVDIEMLTESSLRSSFDAVLGARLERRELMHLWPLFGDLDLLVRLFYSFAVYGQSEYEAWRKELLDDLDRVRQVILVRWAAEAANHLEDLLGAALDKDWDSAAWLGRDFLTACGKALAASRGHYYMGRKWVFRQLELCAPKSFDQERFRSDCLGGWASRGEGGLVEILAVGQALLLRAQLCGWDTPDAADWEVPESPDGSPIRVPSLMPMRLDEGILLNDDWRRQVVVSPTVAAVWLIGAGRDSDAVDEVKQHLPGSLNYVSVVELADRHKRLKETGLLVEGRVRLSPVAGFSDPYFRAEDDD